MASRVRVVKADKWFKDMAKFKDSDLPRAIAHTFNIAAEAHQELVKKGMKNEFTLRNKFTEGSLKSWKARPKKNLISINSVSGSYSPYIWKHESGGTVRAKRKRLPMTTEQGRVGKSMKRVTAKRYRLYQKGRITKGTAKTQGKMFYLNLNRRPGFYIRQGRKLWMIHSLKKSSIRIKGTKFWTNADRALRKVNLSKYFNKMAKRLVFLINPLKPHNKLLALAHTPLKVLLYLT